MKNNKYRAGRVKKFRDAIVKWRKNITQCDPDEVKIFRRDCKDLKEILKAYIENDYKGADMLMYRLDTLVRDQIPKAVYNEIFDKASDLS